MEGSRKVDVVAVARGFSKGVRTDARSDKPHDPDLYYRSSRSRIPDDNTLVFCSDILPRD